MIIGMLGIGITRRHRVVIVIVSIGYLVLGCSSSSSDPTPISCIGEDTMNTGMTHIVGGLVSGQTYYWRIKSEDSRGGQTISPVQSFTTL